MKVPNQILLIVLSMLLLQDLRAQTRRDSLSLSISLPFKHISNEKQMKLFIQIKNISDREILVYDEFIEGYDYDLFTNLNFRIEAKNKAGYKIYEKRSKYNVSITAADTNDLIKKSILYPGKSRGFYYQLNKHYSFSIGAYRMRIVYRNKAMDQERFLPEKDLNKLYSNWIYFSVSKEILPQGIRNKP